MEEGAGNQSSGMDLGSVPVSFVGCLRMIVFGELHWDVDALINMLP